MLMPKRVKHRKEQRGRMRGLAYRGRDVSFGEFGLAAMEPGWITDRQIGPDRVAIPALLATAAVHHHLIRKGLRTSVGLVVETGEPREVHHFACLAGYGCS